MNAVLGLSNNRMFFATSIATKIQKHELRGQAAFFNQNTAYTIFEFELDCKYEALTARARLNQRYSKSCFIFALISERKYLDKPIKPGSLTYTGQDRADRSQLYG